MYSIGEIAKLVKISADTLRHYDQIDLFKPEYVAESNRYRYYSKDQVSQLLLIMQLKEYGFGLDAIRELIHNGVNENPSRLKQALHSRLLQLHMERETLEKTVLSVKRRITQLEGVEEGMLAKRVIVVDDSAFMRQILRDILEKHGYIVIGEAANGQEGIAKYQETKPDMVIMDIHMPELDGITAMERIMELDPQAAIVVLSARGFLANVMDSLEKGARDFIVKPFQPETLVTAINKLDEEKISYTIDTLQAIRDHFGERAANKGSLSQETIAKLLTFCSSEFDQAKFEELSDLLTIDRGEKLEV